MAVHYYLRVWDQSHLSPTFGNFTLDRFLAIPHREAVEHGERFALQHQNLCDTLRRTLMQKVLLDQTESIIIPRKKSSSDRNCLTLNNDECSRANRLVLRKRLFTSQRLLAADRTLVTCEERVVGKDRPGFHRVRADKRRGQRGSQLRRTDPAEFPDSKRLNAKDGSPAKRGDRRRGLSPVSRANAGKRCLYV